MVSTSSCQATGRLHRKSRSTSITSGSRTRRSRRPTRNSFNYFCDSTTFDCRQPGGVGVVYPPYQGTAKAGPILSTGRFFQLQSDGALFALPGGKVRIATGVEYDYWEAEKHTSTNTDPYKHDRAAFAELYVPIFGRGNALPGLHSLEIDVAGRYDDYSDTGVTRNPKIGINWAPFDDLKFHASYGTSFRGPPIQDEGSLAPTFTTTTAAASAISPAICPQCTNPALFGPFGSNKLIYSEAMGNQTNLKPETSTSYSFGFDWSPQAVPGLLAGVNWWWIKYTNQVGNPESNAGGVGAINQQYYNGHIIYNPTFFPQLAANNPLAYMEPNPRANLADPNCAAVVGKRVTTQALYKLLRLLCGGQRRGPEHHGHDIDESKRRPGCHVLRSAERRFHDRQWLRPQCQLRLQQPLGRLEGHLHRGIHPQIRCQSHRRRARGQRGRSLRLRVEVQEPLAVGLGTPL